MRTVMKNAMTFILFLLACNLTNAQSPEIFHPNHFSNLRNPHQKFRMGLDAGTSFSSFGNGFTLLSNSITPRFNWQANKNFTLEAGISFTTFHSGSIPFQSLSGTMSGNGFTGISGYASGQYQASQRLIISGSVFRQSSMSPGLTLNPGAFQFLNQGVSVGFDYKISDKFSFGAGFQINQYSGPGLLNRSFQVW